jgi:hypothetical protein
LDHDPPPSINEAGEERQFHRCRTNILQRNHLAPAASVGQRHTEKQILPDLKTGKKTKLPI